MGAPEATRERLALRSLQELSSLIPAGGDAAATAGLLRVDGARSCEDVLFRLIRELRCSYAVMRTLAIHIRLPILSDSAEVLLSACICFCSCLEAFHPGNTGSG